MHFYFTIQFFLLTFEFYLIFFAHEMYTSNFTVVGFHNRYFTSRRDGSKIRESDPYRYSPPVDI